MIAYVQLTVSPPRNAHSPVDAVAQLLSGLEERHRLLVHRHRLAGAGIAPGPGVAPLHCERTKTAQLDALAARQRPSYLVEYRRHDQLDIRPPQVRVGGGKFRDEFRLGQCANRRTTVQLPERCQTTCAPSRITPWESTLFHSSVRIQPRLVEKALLA